METPWDYEELADVLAHETAVQRDLLAAAIAMNEAVKLHNDEKVRALTGLFDTLSGQMEDLEAQRIELCRNFARTTLHTDVTVKLATIVASAPEGLSARITECGQKLKSGVMELARLTTETRVFIEAHLSGISNNVQLLCQHANKLNNYRFSGTVDPSPVRRTLVNRTA